MSKFVTKVEHIPSITEIEMDASDLSASVPAGAKYVMLMWSKKYFVVITLGARKNGSTLTRSRSFVAGIEGGITMITECDANRIIEYYKGSTNAELTLWGYYS